MKYTSSRFFHGFATAAITTSCWAACAVSFALAFASAAVASEAAASAPTQEAFTLREFEERFAATTNGHTRRGLVIRLANAVANRELILAAADHARLARFLFRTAITENPRYFYDAFNPWNMIAAFNHPAIRDSLADYLKRTALTATTAEPDDPLLAARIRAMTALVRLNDDRVLPHVLTEAALARGETQRAAIALLGMTGDEDVLPALHALASDTTLIERYEKHFAAILGRRPQWRGPTAAEQAARESEEIRWEANRAIDLITGGGEGDLLCLYPLPESARRVLHERGFVIVPEPKNEIYEYYRPFFDVAAHEAGHHEPVMITQPFVTSDLSIHTYAILLRAGLEEFESLVLRERLGRFCRDFAAACLECSRAWPAAVQREIGTESAVHNAALFAVPALLCGETAVGDLEWPETWRQEVERELARIAAHEELAPSRILGYIEDYREYEPVGRYEERDLGSYFQAVSWLGRAVLPVARDGATRRALLLLDVLEHRSDLAERWRELDRIYGAFFGPPDDMTFPSYRLELARVVPREGMRALEVAQDTTLVRRWQERLAHLPPPRINTRYVPPTDAWWQQARGLRILGQRYTRDALVFQEAMELGTWPVSGLHVAAEVFGSSRAATAVSLDPEITVLPDPEVAQAPDLHARALYALQALFEPEIGAPAVFLTPDWEAKQLNTALGAWAELRATTAPYLKAAHLYLGIESVPPDFHGYVEPYPRFYARLADVVERLHALCEEFGVYDAIAADITAVPPPETIEKATAGLDPLSDAYRRALLRASRANHADRIARLRLGSDQLPAFANLLRQLAVMAERELAGEPQTMLDGILLRSLGDRIRHLSFNESSANVAEESMARIVDVATEYLHGERLAAGVGRPVAIYVAVPHGERRIVCRGGIYTYYEFVRPVGERLDPAGWRAAAGNARNRRGPSRQEALVPRGRAAWLSEQGLLDPAMVTGDENR